MQYTNWLKYAEDMWKFTTEYRDITDFSKWDHRTKYN
jgi:hypothetical protein